MRGTVAAHTSCLAAHRAWGQLDARGVLPRRAAGLRRRSSAPWWTPTVRDAR